jgi:hypothetical protein
VGFFFFERFGRREVVIEIAGLFFFMICVFFISYYIWVCARVLIRFISFGVLSFNFIIAKMILFKSLLLKVLRGFFD